MVMKDIGSKLSLEHVPDPKPNKNQLLLKVLACGVCRTDLHILDGELPHPKLPLILGHEIIGEVIQVGENVEKFSVGDHVGVPWLGWTCGNCFYCQTGRENLCDNALFNGYSLNGGYSELTVADQRYCFLIDDQYSSQEAAPLMCAGLIGHRAFKMTGEGYTLGIYGFGAAAHVVVQTAIQEGLEVYAFTRPGDISSQNYAQELGVIWAGDSNILPPKPLDNSLIFAPVGDLVVSALNASSKGATIVCAGIHMSDIPSMPYSLLWDERILRTVANLTRADGQEFLSHIQRTRIKTHTIPYPLEHANEALEDLRYGKFNGAAVLVP